MNLTGQSDADLDSKQGLAGLLIGLGTSVGVVVNICKSSLLEREDIEKLGVFRISAKHFNESLSQHRPVRGANIPAAVVDRIRERLMIQ